MRTKINKKALVILLSLFMILSVSVIVFPIKAYEKPKTSQGVDLTIVMLGSQQMPGIQNVTAEFLASKLGSGVHSLTVQSSGDTADLQLAALQTLMQGGGATAHVIDLDVVWTAQFASHGWVIPLDSYLSDVNMSDYGSGIVAACTYKGHYYAFPYFMNLGVLYYRKDLLDLHMPGWTPDDFATWEGLNQTANFILNNGSGLLTPADANLVGYLGQLDAYEGGVVNFFEWCGSNGALDVVTSTNQVNINTAKVIEAMNFISALVPPQYVGVQGSDYIIPRAGLVMDEGSSGNAWLAGDAIFLRQWPYIYSLSEAAHMDFGLAPIPHFEGASGYKTSCVGGGILAVPTDTTGVAREAAVNLTKFLGMKDAQEAELAADIVAGDGKYTPQGNFPALKSVFANPPTGFEWIKNWTEQAALTLSRPVHPDYPLISSTISDYFSLLLSGAQSVSTALSNMQRDVEEIVAGTPAEPAIPGFSIAVLIISVTFTVGLIMVARKKNK